MSKTAKRRVRAAGTNKGVTKSRTVTRSTTAVESYPFHDLETSQTRVIKTREERGRSSAKARKLR